MRVLLIGDLIADVNRYGKATRLCPEAPVPVWVPESQDERAGGMGLVAENLTALSVDGTAYVRSSSKKIRFWSGEHLLMREDQDSYHVSKSPIPQKLIDSIKDYDAVVISDYNKGGITDMDALRLIANGTTVPVFVDTKRPNPNIYAGCYAIFPNDAEFEKLGRLHVYQHVIHKVGAQGCYVDDELIPVESAQVFDVTGAGDVFLATFVWAFLNNKSLKDAAKLANKAASISVQHVGGYCLTPSDVTALAAYL